jgi:predicted amidophosphoribosyltransferase/DNA-binding HxlR family transcriptional regulator
MKTAIQSIEEIIFSEKQITADALKKRLGVSQVLVHRHLKRLVQVGKIKKRGTPPKVFYVPVVQESKKSDVCLASKIIEENWLEITPNGEFLYGEKGFLRWCDERSFDPEQQATRYKSLFLEKEKWKQNGLIDATEKITKSFEKNYLEKFWYIDFYSWEIFGRTLLGKLILYAKQNSDEVLMKAIAKRIQSPILSVIKREKFSFIGTVPHSVPRKKDFLATTLSYIAITPKPERIFSKIFADHAVAQKTLKSKQEREQNAEETLFLLKKTFPEKILLIDDACGSGATLNISAEKIKKVSPETKVFGLTFVGSIKGFEVIPEM